MSSMTQIVSEIKSLIDLERACNRLGITLVRGKTEARYYGHKTVTCDHTIEIPRTAFDIAVKKRHDGTYVLSCDLYGPEGRVIADTCGKSLGLLKQAYAVEVAKSEARKKNMRVTEERKTDGRIRVKLKVVR